MYEEFLARKLAEAAVTWAAQVNTLAETNYLGAARDWATNKTFGAQAPPPLIPRVVRFDVKDGNLVPIVTDTPVSNVTPESFLPTYGTDINAFGGPVGGLIPGYTDRYYATSDARPNAGEIYRHGTAMFVYQRPTPFGGFWVML